MIKLDNLGRSEGWKENEHWFT